MKCRLGTIAKNQRPSETTAAWYHLCLLVSGTPGPVLSAVYSMINSPCINPSSWRLTLTLKPWLTIWGLLLSLECCANSVEHLVSENTFPSQRLGQQLQTLGLYFCSCFGFYPFHYPNISSVFMTFSVCFELWSSNFTVIGSGVRQTWIQILALSLLEGWPQ